MTITRVTFYSVFLTDKHFYIFLTVEHRAKFILTPYNAISKLLSVCFFSPSKHNGLAFIFVHVYHVRIVLCLSRQPETCRLRLIPHSASLRARIVNTIRALLIASWTTLVLHVWTCVEERTCFIIQIYNS